MQGHRWGKPQANPIATAEGKASVVATMTMALQMLGGCAPQPIELICDAPHRITQFPDGAVLVHLRCCVSSRPTALCHSARSRCNPCGGG